MAQWILKDTMVITTSHTCRPLIEDEYRDLNLIKQRDNFMEKYRLSHGNKKKTGNSTVSKLETVSEDDGTNDYEHMYFPDIPVDKTTMPEQDVIDDEGNPIQGLNHIVDSYINMEV